MNNQAITKIAVFSSGGGSNLKAIHTRILSDDIPGKIELLISNNQSSGAIEFADKHHLQTLIINQHRYPDPQQATHELQSQFAALNINLIILAGYMKKIASEIVQAYDRRILNIHPALLPKFGGKGFYGMNVHQAVLDAKEKESGASVHFVDAEYDSGPIIATRIVPVLPGDSKETLAKRVLEQEHLLYPEVVKAYCENRITWNGDIPQIIEKEKCE